MSNYSNAVLEQSFVEKELEWNNSDNNAFYETLKADGLQKLAEKGGLATGCDMKELTPYWSNANSILEVGAGYGRVINYLTTQKFQGTITAIERCDILFQYLKNEYTRYKNVRLLHRDVIYLDNLNTRFDLILILWSGIADFTPQEQKMIFIKLAKLLSNKGKLIIDTLPPHTVPLDMTPGSMQRTYKQEINNTVIYTYSMSISEINEYAQYSNFKNISHIIYYTEAHRKRLLHILC